MVRLKYKKGISLIELMTVVTIMGIISLGVVLFSSKAMHFFRLTEAKIEVQRDARICLNIMNKQIKQAKASTIVIDKLNTSQPPYSRIYFETIKGTTVQYYQDGTELKQAVTKPGGATKVSILTKNLRYVFFVYPRTDNDSILHISICLEKIPYPYVKGAKALQLSVEKVRIMN